jgi:hypothetical protein
MLEVKTRGNLDKQEQDVLKQSLTGLRMAFVESVNHPKTAAAPAPAGPAANAPATDEQEMPINEPALPGEKTPPSAGTESRKIFSKKYS